MPTIVDGVDFAHVAREWRCKWDTADDKASLAACQKALATKLDAIKAVPGVVSVQRVVCGGCQDFKVIAKLEAAKFADWEAAAFAPEAEFLKEVEAIPGVKKVETQTFTLEDLWCDWMRCDARGRASGRAVGGLATIRRTSRRRRRPAFGAVERRARDARLARSYSSRADFFAAKQV